MDVSEVRSETAPGEGELPSFQVAYVFDVVEYYDKAKGRGFKVRRCVLIG
jgi:hypothetical protein